MDKGRTEKCRNRTFMRAHSWTSRNRKTRFKGGGSRTKNDKIGCLSTKKMKRRGRKVIEGEYFVSMVMMNESRQITAAIFTRLNEVYIREAAR